MLREVIIPSPCEIGLKALLCTDHALHGLLPQLKLAKGTSELYNAVIMYCIDIASNLK